MSIAREIPIGFRDGASLRHSNPSPRIGDLSRKRAVLLRFSQRKEMGYHHPRAPVISPHLRCEKRHGAV